MFEPSLCDVDADQNESATFDHSLRWHSLSFCKERGRYFWCMLYLATAQRFIADINSATTQGMVDGGLAGLFWSYVWTWLGFSTVMASLAEMASMCAQLIPGHLSKSANNLAGHRQQAGSSKSAAGISKALC